MEEWQKEALAIAVMLRDRGEVRITSGGEDFVFAAGDLIALGVMVLAAGPDRTVDVVCSWLDRARVGTGGEQ